MGIPDVFGSPYIHNGQSYPQFKMGELAELTAVIEAAKRDRVKANAKDQKLTPEQTARLLVLAETEVDLVAVDRYANSIRGSRDVCIRSLVKGGMADKQAAPIVGELTADEANEIALYVVGCIRQKAKDGDDKSGGSPANPSDAGGASTGEPTAG